MDQGDEHFQRQQAHLAVQRAVPNVQRQSTNSMIDFHVLVFAIKRNVHYTHFE